MQGLVADADSGEEFMVETQDTQHANQGGNLLQGNLMMLEHRNEPAIYITETPLREQGILHLYRHECYAMHLCIWPSCGVRSPHVENLYRGA